jgi:hypothetical protein
MKELSVIQKTHDLIKWYVPILERLPRTYKFTVGNKMIREHPNYAISINTKSVGGQITFSHIPP